MTTREHPITRLDYSAVRAEMLRRPIDAGEGPFAPTVESLRAYRCPDWFHNAKFGIWAHWSAQCVPKQGDWYARRMYLQGEEHYDYHLEHYGHPSRFGYKDLLPLWKAQKFDPDALMELYRESGARYFVALGVHADNFDCWNSKYHRWNSCNLGPQRDIVGEWRAAARRHGLFFGVSEHVSNYYHWLGTSHGADRTGPLAGVPFDGADPSWGDLYNTRLARDREDYLNPEEIPEGWAREHYWRMRDLIDQHEPDLFYVDGAPALGQISLQLLAYYYNVDTRRHGGRLRAVCTIKDHPGLGEFIPGIATQDIERGLAGDILPDPWQVDTCLGDWHYKEGIKYKSAQSVIRLLADVVSKNGNMLLSVPLLPEGDVDEECRAILADLRDWLGTNGEAIYETRPWRVYGENVSQSFDGKMHHEPTIEPVEGEFRFTRKDDNLYALLMRWPQHGKCCIASLAEEANAVEQVRLLGAGPCSFRASSQGLEVSLPKQSPSLAISVLEIQLQENINIP